MTSMRYLRVGDVVELLVHCLGNEPGTNGVVVEEYELGGHGVMVIFPNGEYDGFSEDEQLNFLQFVRHDERMESYVFTNVMQLSRDFQDKLFTFTKG